MSAVPLDVQVSKREDSGKAKFSSKPGWSSFWPSRHCTELSQDDMWCRSTPRARFYRMLTGDVRDFAPAQAVINLCSPRLRSEALRTLLDLATATEEHPRLAWDPRALSCANHPHLQE